MNLSTFKYCCVLNPFFKISLGELAKVDLENKGKVTCFFYCRQAISHLSYIEYTVPLDRDCSIAVVSKGFGAQALPVSQS